MKSWIDFTEKFKIFIFLVISAIFAIIYVKGRFKSIRNCTSDVIAISSIILGILGVFIGLLISMKSSDFIKKLNKNLSKGNVFEYLLKYIRKQFCINLVFVFSTVMIDFAPSISNLILKGILITIWLFLFLLTLWGSFYAVDMIAKIEFSDYKLNNKDDKNQK